MTRPHFIFAVAFFVLTSFSLNKTGNSKFPYHQAGLTERQAAAHLISRFTFGTTPHLVDEVVTMGLEKWFAAQLNGNEEDQEVKNRLKNYDALNLSNSQVLMQFPRGPQVRKMAVADGFLNKDSLNNLDKPSIKKKLNEYKNQKGIRDERELYRQFLSQKIIRAVYGKNQLHEVLTDFWFNHFNVSATKNQCALFIPAYERDVIRPNVTGDFFDLLIATAQSPAMLLYLDNASSMGIEENIEDTSLKQQPRTRVTRRGIIIQPMPRQRTARTPKKKTSQGLNENYAREIMELHTLGVDGGYTQQDVTEAARVLTGWTVYPMKDGNNEGMRKKLDGIGESRLASRGFVHKGDFLFVPTRHDAKEKIVLGKIVKAGGGYNDGVDLLKMLAIHPSTAKFISKKIAIRFVSDNPPQSLIDKLADAFLRHHGNIKNVLLTLVQAPEFWSAEALRAKTKSPLEYAVSAVRALDADVIEPMPLNQWITKMGQKLYTYAAPTGFPDRGQYWINTGSLLNRMNFGLLLTAKKIKGVNVDLAELNNHHEPESAEAALPVYAELILPERDLEPTLKRLMPMVTSRDVVKKVNEAATQKTGTTITDSLGNRDSQANVNRELKKKPSVRSDGFNKFGDNPMLAQVVGIIIGSPEFQRR